jgi:hypothetical protein
MLMAYHPVRRQESPDQRIQELAERTNVIIARAKALEERGICQLVEAEQRLKRTQTKQLPDEPWLSPPGIPFWTHQE